MAQSASPLPLTTLSFFFAKADGSSSFLVLQISPPKSERSLRSQPPLPMETTPSSLPSRPVERWIPSRRRSTKWCSTFENRSKVTPLLVSPLSWPTGRSRSSSPTCLVSRRSCFFVAGEDLEADHLAFLDVFQTRFGELKARRDQVASRLELTAPTFPRIQNAHERNHRFVASLLVFFFFLTETRPLHVYRNDHPHPRERTHSATTGEPHDRLDPRQLAAHHHRRYSRYLQESVHLFSHTLFLLSSR